MKKPLTILLVAVALTSALSLSAAGILRVSISDSNVVVYPDASNPATGSLVAMEFGDTYSGDRGWGLTAGTGGVISLASNTVMRLTFVPPTGTFGPVLTNAALIKATQVRYFALRARVTGFSAGSSMPIRITAPAGTLDTTLPANGSWSVVRADLGAIAGWTNHQKLTVTFGVGGVYQDYQNALVELDWLAVNDSNAYNGGLDYTRFDQFWNLGYPAPAYSGSLAAPIRLNRTNSAGADMMYQRYQLVDPNRNLIGNAHYADDWSALTYSVVGGKAPLPVPSSINGLDAYGVDDDPTLNPHCAKFNVIMKGYIDQSNPSFTWNVDGVPIGLNKKSFDRLVADVKAFNDRGMAMYLVLLNINGSEPQTSSNVTIPPQAVFGRGKFIGHNTFDPLGRLYYRAFVEYLAYRLSGPGNGAVTGYIVGNEVDAHPAWHQVGPLSETEFIGYYAELMRLTDLAIRKYNPYSTARVSMTRHWEIFHTIKSPVLLTRMNAMIQAEGNFPWGVVQHCYGEKGAGSTTWWTATNSAVDFNTGYLTYNNLEMLPQYLSQAAFLYQGRLRAIAFTENGFSASKPSATSQAAAYAYAYRKMIRIPQIEGHTYHSYVDHGPQPWGLVDKQGVHRPLYDLFKHADAPDWRTYFDPFLSSLPITNWDQAVPVWGSFNCDFNETGFAEGWQPNGQVANLTVTNGALSGTATGSDPQIMMATFFAATDVAARFFVRMKSATASRASFYWKTAAADTFADARSFSFDVLGDNAYHVYEVVAFTNAGWRGQVLTGWRFDPLASPGSFEIDYIHIAPPQLVITSAQSSGTNLVLTGALGIPGDTFSVRSATNLALAASAPVLCVGQCDSLGRFSVTNAVSATEPPRHYLISQP